MHDEKGMKRAAFLLCPPHLSPTEAAMKQLAAKTIFPLLVSLALFSHGLAGPGEILLDDYRAGLSPHWQKQIFSGETLYTVVRDGDQDCIRAVSAGTASGLVYKIDYNLEEYPFLSWSWKVEHALQQGDERSKKTDDYAARVYVVFPSVFFWKTRALNYIWANKIPQGSTIPNSYTANAMMIAVQSGPEKAGRWLTETRNVYEDYRKAFGQEPPRAGAIAIMTDTDNTGGQATACYGPVRIFATPP